MSTVLSPCHLFLVTVQSQLLAASEAERAPWCIGWLLLLQLLQCEGWICVGRLVRETSGEALISMELTKVL